MEKLKKVVNEIAYTHDFSKLPFFRRSIVPLLESASYIYDASLTFRNHLYSQNIFRKQRLQVPVISVGNLTWGGNGKTPMVESLSLWFSNSGISPLILTRGYGGGDEGKMLERHLVGTSVKVGIGANRVMTAASFIDRYSYADSYVDGFFEKLLLVNKVATADSSKKIGVAILDDGMQHVCLERDLDIVMVNGLEPWGNNKLIPLGPLREPLSALARADIVVIHHADLVPAVNLIKLKWEIIKMKESLPVFFSKMVPSHFFKLYCGNTKVPLSAVEGRVVLCLSAIGFPIAFAKSVRKLTKHVYELHYSDHYEFQSKDILKIKKRIFELQRKHNSKPIVVTTEKDYDRDREILFELRPCEVLVLCSQLQFLSHRNSQKRFKEVLKQLLDSRSKKIVNN